ncbi:MAG TPA: hypothetical protein PLZ39_07635, partial [Verrucomicrobiota bacterium]|nr:hypothetical protein [Verrucomicrobiota bacterium]
VRRWAFGDGSSEMGVRRWEFGDGSSEMGVRRWAFGDGSSEMGVRSSDATGDVGYGSGSAWSA